MTLVLGRNGPSGTGCSSGFATGGWAVSTAVGDSVIVSMRVAPRGSLVAGLPLRVNRGGTGACRCYRPARMGSEDLAACAATGGMVYGGGRYLKGRKWR